MLSNLFPASPTQVPCPCRLIDEPAFKSPAEQHVYDVVTKEEKSITRHLPESSAVITLPIPPFPPPPLFPCHSFDESS